MTEEEKKEFEEFLQWKAEKKQKEEEEEAERQAKLVDQKCIAADQVRAEADIIDTPEPNNWENEKVNLINLYKKAYLVYVFLYL